MDALIELDAAVSRLLARTEALSAENTRLKAELAMRSQSLAEMEEKIAELRSVLAAEAKLRDTVRGRLDVLIGHINKYTCQR